MRNTLKVAKWEMKRNIKNKSFIISLFLTPALFALFFTLPYLLSSFDSDDQPMHVYINDELGVWSDVEPIVLDVFEYNWKIEETSSSLEDMRGELVNSENTAFITLNEQTIEEGRVDVYLSEDVPGSFMGEVRVLEEPIRQLQLMNLGLSEEELAVISQGVVFESETVGGEEVAMDEGMMGIEGDWLERGVPGIFAGVILFSIIMSGMMIFQSASQEKKDKVAEIILSSLTPTELMQGKILGYFGLGLTQVTVWLALVSPLVLWRVDISIFEYLFVPELAVLLLIAIAGYLLFASIFVGIGATIEDISTSGNFQSMVLMLPFIPFILIGPLLSNPSGIVAQVASFIPFTAPGVLIIRLTVMEEWPWLEIIAAIVVLLVFIVVFMKLAGKIFKVGILLYGKNATPGEIWKWTRA